MSRSSTGASETWRVSSPAISMVMPSGVAGGEWARLVPNRGKPCTARWPGGSFKNRLPRSIRFRMHTVRYGSTWRQPRELNRARPDPHSPRELDPAGLASVGLRGAGRGPRGVPGQGPRRDKGWLLLALPRPTGSPGRDAWRLGRDPRRPSHRDL